MARKPFVETSAPAFMNVVIYDLATGKGFAIGGKALPVPEPRTNGLLSKACHFATALFRRAESRIPDAAASKEGVVVMDFPETGSFELWCKENNLGVRIEVRDNSSDHSETMSLPEVKFQYHPLPSEVGFSCF